MDGESSWIAGSGKEPLIISVSSSYTCFLKVNHQKRNLE
jgi:hypothetical protein